MKTKPYFIIAAAMLFSLFLASQALALRCGDNLIEVGSTMDQLVQSCGQPMRKTVAMERNGGNNDERRSHTGITLNETWYYDFGDGGVTIITLKDGRITNIQYSVFPED